MVSTDNIDSTATTSQESTFARRYLTDRRTNPTPFLSRYWLIGRRRGGRRAGEDVNVYVDRYTTFEWLIVFGVLALSIADFVLTLIHLSNGGAEANPIMAWAWRGGDVVFGAVKIGITLFSLSLLLIHIRFRRSDLFLAFAFLLYAGVFAYHQALPFLMK